MFSTGHAAVAVVMQKIWQKTLGERWSAKEHFGFFLGSVLPDLPVFFPGAKEFIKWLRGDDPESLFGAIWRNTGYYHTFIGVRELFHDVWFWTLIILLCGLIMRKKHGNRWLPFVLRLSSSAIMCHILVDWPTHTMRVHNYLWPLARHPQVGIMSHADPYLWLLEFIVIVLAGNIIWESRFAVQAAFQDIFTALRHLVAKKGAAL